MKKIIFIFSAILVVIASCDDITSEQIKPKEGGCIYIPVVTDASGPDSKASYYEHSGTRWSYSWSAGDRFRYFKFNDGQYAGQTSEGLVTIYERDSYEDYAYVNFSADGLAVGDVIYTYFVQDDKDGQKIINTDPSAVKMIIPASQSYSDGQALVDAMPCASGLRVITKEHLETPSSITDAMVMYMLGSAAEFRIYSSKGTYADETIKGVRFCSSTPCAGYCYYNISTETKQITGLDELILTSTSNDNLKVTDVKPEHGQLYFIIAPGTYDGNIDIITENSGQSKIHRFNVRDLKFDRLIRTPFKVDLDSDYAIYSDYFDVESAILTDNIDPWQYNENEYVL